MFFSIVIPVYNSEKYLIKTVDSIINQQFSDYEIILVDDGSTDSSPKLCDELQNKYTQIISIHQQNAGPASARNMGIQKASGEYILFIDSDDEYDPDSLNYLHMILSKAKYDVLCFGYSNIIQNNEQRVNVGDVCKKSVEIYQTKSEIESSVLDIIDDRVTFSSCCTKAYKLDLLKQNNVLMPQDIIIGEDFCFNLRVLLHCQSYYFSDKVLYKYIAQNQSSIMTRFNPNKIKYLVKMHTYRNEFLKNYPEIDEQVLEINIKMDYVRICYSAYMDLFSPNCKMTKKEKINFINETKKSIKYDFNKANKSLLSKKQKMIYGLFATQKNFILYYSSWACYFLKFKLNKTF